MRALSSLPCPGLDLCTIQFPGTLSRWSSFQGAALGAFPSGQWRLFLPPGNQASWSQRDAASQGFPDTSGPDPAWIGQEEPHSHCKGPGGCFRAGNGTGSDQALPAPWEPQHCLVLQGDSLVSSQRDPSPWFPAHTPVNQKAFLYTISLWVSLPEV